MATSNSNSLRLPKKTVNEFKFIKEIGNGSYSTVFFAIETSTNRELAIKAVSKDLITRLKKKSQIFREKDILARLSDCPYAVKLYCTFQDEKTLYFGLTYCPNGDLLQHINIAGHFSEDIVRFYAAELIEALEQLQNRQIIHRDLKPENILLTDDMHIQLTDFGTGIIIDSNESHFRNNVVDGDEKSVRRTNSFVGTAQFVAPEILKRGDIHFGSDLWALGCIIYQMATGKHLFRGTHEYDIINSVVRVSYNLPNDLPVSLSDLVQNLVKLDPRERLGSKETGGMNKLKAHKFFSQYSYETKWGSLLNQPSPLQGKPQLCSRPKLTDDELQMMSSGFDARVEARLIGLNMATDLSSEIDSLITNSANLILSNDISNSQQLDNRNTTSTTFDSLSSNNSYKMTDSHIVARRVPIPDHAINLSEQATKNVYHKFVQNNLIFRQGILDKKKGLFAKRRMFLITEGPAIYYVDPEAMELKGTISWTADLRIEQKDMKTFHIHVPGRTYHLTDPEQDASTWCRSLISIHVQYYNTDPTRKLSSSTSSSSIIQQSTVPVTEL